jgi:hypothetical protein
MIEQSKAVHLELDCSGLLEAYETEAEYSEVSAVCYVVSEPLG